MDKNEKIEREKYYNKLKKQLGITLIALVITIIILLIIAGISIAQLTGSGIFEKALEAKERYKNAQELEDSVLSSYGIEKISSTRDTTEVNPVGTVISCIRTTAPAGYLICDGTEYNISEYPELAEELRKVYNGYNTENVGKFKVPDLRGEFLRGAGTNGHENQGGGEDVGEHQDGTQHLMAGMESNNLGYISSNPSGGGEPLNYDNRFSSGTIRTFESKGSASNTYKMYTSRPTNTSVLYCIKY